MKNILSVFLLIFISSVIYAYAQDEENAAVEVPAGMELRKEGPLNILIPKGAELHREGGLIRIEGTDQYMARKLIEIEKRFNKIETEQGKLIEKIEQLIETIDELKQGVLSSESNE